MRLEPNEILMFEEDIHPEARVEVEAVCKQLDDLKAVACDLHAQMDLLGAKATYLNKVKWAVFDKYHKHTQPSHFENKDGKEYFRRYDWEENKVGIVEKTVDPMVGTALDAIKELVSALKESGKKDIKIEVIEEEAT